MIENTNEIHQENKCCGCGLIVSDKYYLVIASKFYWHFDCLKCATCQQSLKNKCYMHNGRPYCSEDYQK